MKLKRSWAIFFSITGVLILIMLIALISVNFFKQTEAPVKTEREILEEKGIIYVDKESFTTEANTLLDKGYSATEINQIYEYMSDRNLDLILSEDYKDLSAFYEISNFDFSKIDRYLAYQSLENLEMSDAVTRVNLNLDKPFYSEVEEITDPESITVLVNKYHALPSDYVPSDLVTIPGTSLQIREVALEDYQNLIAAATLDGLNLIPYSTYRSYDYQDSLYNYYLGRDPQSEVDTYSARPGHSEHQTGLAIDIRSSVLSDSLTDADYEWMQNNSYKYGFIIRYPKDGSTITGYMEEPWHIRYVGVEAATKIHESGLHFDEYYDLYLTTY